MSLFLLVALWAAPAMGGESERFQTLLVDPCKPAVAAKKRWVVLSLDERGFPKEYQMHLQTEVCPKGVCKLLDVTLFWDAVGNYLRLEYPKRLPLTKKDHDPFGKEDYEKLDSLLKDRRSILGSHPLEFFVVEKPAASGGTDAVTSATPIAAKAAIVDGTAYTTWALWRWVNGEIVGKLVSRTLPFCKNTDYLLACLGSADPELVRFGLNSLREHGMENRQLCEAALGVLERSGRQECLLAMEWLEKNPPDPAALHRELIDRIGVNPGSSHLILNYLEKLPDADPLVWEQLAARLSHLSSLRDLDAALAVLSDHAKNSETVRRQVEGLLASKDRFVVMRAEAFILNSAGN